ncbi:MAG: HAD family phosphatase [Candidatus Gracilibacteria bacterium]
MKNPKKIRAILWDMDGVLIDSEAYHIRAENETLKEYGIHVTPEISKPLMGCTFADYFKGVAAYFKKDLPTAKILRDHAKRLENYAQNIFPLVDHAPEVLEKLSHHYLMALATSSSHALAHTIVNRLNAKKIFKAILTGDDIQKGKPNPEIFLKAADRLGVPPEQCAVIEDSLNGFRAAKAAGMFLIARKAEHNEHQDFSLADGIITDLKEIKKALA